MYGNHKEEPSGRGLRSKFSSRVEEEGCVEGVPTGGMPSEATALHLRWPRRWLLSLSPHFPGPAPWLIFMAEPDEGLNEQDNDLRLLLSLKS